MALLKKRPGRPRKIEVAEVAEAIDSILVEPIITLECDEPPPDTDPEYQPEATPQKDVALVEARFNAIQNAQYQNALIESMGKNRRLLARICSISTDSKIVDFMLALGKMKYKNWSTTRIASLFGVTPAMLSTIWRDYHMSEAMLTITSSLPKTAERMVQDAAGGQTVCPHCDGRTTVRMEIQVLDGELKEDSQPRYKIVVCPNCEGEGVVFKPGHEHSRDRIFEAVGLTKKGGIQVTTVIQMPNVESIIDELERSKAVPVTYSESPQ
jgi:hypothetical protein